MTKNAKNAIKKYGHEVCVACWQMWKAGEGANTIGKTNSYITLTTRQADAAIQAGRELASEDRAYDQARRTAAGY